MSALSAAVGKALLPALQQRHTSALEELFQAAPHSSLSGLAPPKWPCRCSCSVHMSDDALLHVEELFQRCGGPAQFSLRALALP